MSELVPDALDRWYVKAEVARLLRCSDRSIDRKVGQGLIEKRERFKSGRRPEPVYNPSDVDSLAALKPVVMPGDSLLNGNGHRERDREIAFPPSISQAAALLKQLLEPAAARILEALSTRQIAAPADNAPPAALPLWLAINEASVYSGLSQGRLKRFVRQGQLAAVRQKGGMKIRRADLDQLAANDFYHAGPSQIQNTTMGKEILPRETSEPKQRAAMVRLQSKGAN